MVPVCRPAARGAPSARRRGSRARHLPDIRHAACFAATRELDDVVDGRMDRRQGKAGLRFGGERVEAVYRFLGPVGVQRAEGAVVAGVHGANQLERLRPTDLAERDAVGGEAECLAEVGQARQTADVRPRQTRPAGSTTFRHRLRFASSKVRQSPYSTPINRPVRAQGRGHDRRAGLLHLLERRTRPRRKRQVCPHQRAIGRGAHLSGLARALCVATRNDARPDARFRAVSGARWVRLERAADADSVRPSAWLVRRTRDRGGRARTWRNRSDRQACSAHLVGELVGPGRVEIAAQQLPDLGGTGVELLTERAQVVAVPGELWLEIVQPP